MTAFSISARRYRTPLLLGALLLIPATAHADLVWPALFLETRLLSWWAIGIGLVTEYFVVRWVFNLSYRDAVLPTLAANVVSTLAGILLVPLGGFAAEFLLYVVSSTNTFDPSHWVASFVTACLVNTALETLVYRMEFDVKIDRRVFGWIMVANGASVGVAGASLVLYPMIGL